MALHGYTKLELARAGKVVKRIEKHNVISPYVSGLTKQGNLWYMESGLSIYPLIDKMFGGCLLTDKVNPDGDEVSGFFGMIAGDSNIVAQCSNDAYNGNNARRGSYNTNESGVITGGFRHVFDWGTDRGNGTINGVCLTRPQIARADFSDVSTRIPANDSYLNENLGYIYNNVDGYTVNGAFLNMDIIDYEREVGYALYYESGTITVYEYELNTKIFHILGEAGGVRSTKTHTISQTVNNYTSNWSTVTVAYTGDYIHLLTFTANSTTLNDYAIKVADWSCTATTHTFTGVAFTAFRGEDNRRFAGGCGMLIKSGYLYAISGNNGQKIVKCNLSNDADVTEYDNPVYSVAGTSWGNAHGNFVLLPNGDFYITDINSGIKPLVYWHNNTFYYAKRSSSRLNRSVFGNQYGTFLGVCGYDDYGGYPAIFLDTMFPYVSTVNNLEEAVTKSADLTMKLTYELTETSN